MTPPVKRLREDDPRRECCADDEKRAGPSPLSLPPLELGLAGSDCGSRARLQIGRRLALEPRLDEARLHPAQEYSVFGEWLGEPGRRPATRGGAVGELLQTIGPLLEDRVAGHFFTGGSSPVATRQMREAAVRATMVASAARPA
jgi:hypothetical protein